MKYKMNIKLLPVIALALASTAVTVYQLEFVTEMTPISNREDNAVGDQQDTNDYEIMERFVARQARLRDKCAANSVPPLQTRNIFMYVPQFNMSTCFVPKAASKTWAAHIISATNASRTINYNIHTSAQKQFPLRKENRLNILKTSNSFVFVRHPFERFVSAFRMRGKKFCFQLKHFDGSGCYHFVPSFPSFVAYFLYTGVKKWRDQHFIPMHIRCDICHSDFKFIGKMETFSSDSAFIIDHLKMNVPPKKHLNKHSRKKSSHLVTLELMRKLKKSVIWDLYNAFKLDFELFDYDPTDYIAVGKED